MPEQSPVMTPAEAAAYLALDRLGVDDPERTVRRYVARGLLECVVVAGKMCFLRDQLDGFLQRQRRSKTRTAPRRRPVAIAGGTR